MSVGQHVTLVTVDDKTFKGVLDSIDDQAGKVILKKVVSEGCRLQDLQIFFATDIKDLAFSENFVTRDKDSDSLLDHVKSKGGRFLSKKNIPYHLIRAPIFNGDKMLLSHIAGEDDGIDQGIGSGEDGDNFEDFYETDDYILLCRSCEKFREAIVYLMQQEYVAVVFYGVEIGRKGTLSLMQVATKEYIFIFDILRLGKEGFIDGLQELLESQSVMKVIHDSRLPSDILYHQHDVNLSNVFDTQVAGAFMYKNCNEGDWPRSVESLPRALMFHLNLGEKDVHIAFVRERSRKMDEEIWLQRPISKQLLNSTLKNIRKLIPLYHYMWQKLMLPFQVGVQLYLDQVRNAPEGAASKQRISAHLLPHAFQDLEKITASHTRQTGYGWRKSSSYDHKGFKENLLRTNHIQSSVITSRDSIWHAAKKGFPITRSKSSKNSEVASEAASKVKNTKSAASQKSRNEIKKKTQLSSSSQSPSHHALSKKDSKDSSSPEKAADLDSKDSLLNSSPNQSYSPPLFPKSSTPNTSDQAAEASTPPSDIRRSALFMLSDSSSLQSDVSRCSNKKSTQHSCDTVSMSPPALTSQLDELSDSRHQLNCSILQSSLKGEISTVSGTGVSMKHHRSQDPSTSSDIEGKQFHDLCQERCSPAISPSEDETYGLRVRGRMSTEDLFEKMQIVPAGCQNRQIGKKHAKRIQEQKEMFKGNQVSPSSPTKNMLHPSTNELEEDLGSIPMHRSLHKPQTQTQAELRCSSFDLGDPCSIESSMNSFTSKSVLSQLSLPSCPSEVLPLSGTEEDAESEMEDSLVDEILKLEEVQKMLRQIKTDKPSKDIQRKLLSSRIKF